MRYVKVESGRLNQEDWLMLREARNRVEISTGAHILAQDVFELVTDGEVGNIIPFSLAVAWYFRGAASFIRGASIDYICRHAVKSADVLSGAYS